MPVPLYSNTICVYVSHGAHGAYSSKLEKRAVCTLSLLVSFSMYYLGWLALGGFTHARGAPFLIHGAFSMDDKEEGALV